MQAYWICFEGHHPGCLEGTSMAAVILQAEELTGCKVQRVDRLPYPAQPFLATRLQNACPPFCYSPSWCRGHSACPKDYACSE